MKMEKETSGPKNPNVVVKKSALEEFLEEWGSWRGKSKAKAVEKMNRKSAEMTQGSRITRKRQKDKHRQLFGDSVFMLFIKLFVGIVDFVFAMVMWVFSFVFSFKFWALVGVIIYFSDVELTAISKMIGEQKVEDTIQQLDEGAGKISERIESNSERINKAINGWKEQLDGISIDIKKSDGTTIHYDGADIDVWTRTPAEPEAEKANE